jgi:hypothetical protein
MTIEEQMIAVANDLIKKFGTEHIVDLQQLYRIFKTQYNTNEGSIIPSDYCYNRINNGINLNKPTVFEFLGRGQYRCLGLNYPYNGIIYHKPKGLYEISVGKCINGERLIAPDIEYDNPLHGNQIENTARNTHRTQREPSMRLRFEILKRDNFKCCACGASPAKDPVVELHVDHIIPWSKGGETETDNLQTLCAICNLGKSDVH